MEHGTQPWHLSSEREEGWRPDSVVEMSVLAARRMHWTEQEYLAFENASPVKHEYLDGEVFARAGAPAVHNRLASNTLGALGSLIRGRGCGAFNSDQRIYIPRTGLYTYADGGVACGPWEIHMDGMCLLNLSLRHLLLIDQPTRDVRHYWRLPDGGWDSREHHAGRLVLPEWDGAIELDDIYLLEE